MEGLKKLFHILVPCSTCSPTKLEATLTKDVLIIWHLALKYHQWPSLHFRTPEFVDSDNLTPVTLAKLTSFKVGKPTIVNKLNLNQQQSSES